MTLLENIAFYAAFAIAVAISGFPRIIFRNQPGMTSAEIAKLRPDLRRLHLKYSLILWIGVPVAAVLFLAAGLEWVSRPSFNEFFLFFPVIVFLGLYDGLFALITGVYPASKRWEPDRFIYDPPTNHRRMALLQIALAALAILISLAIYLFLPG